MLPNPWIIVGILVAWLASLVAIGHWQRIDGATKANLVCTTEKNALLARAVTAEESARKIEHDKAQELQAIGEQHEMELRVKDTVYQKDIADLHAGNLRLRDRAAKCSSSVVPDASAPATRSDGETGAELSREASEFLLGEAKRADVITEQLSACQAVILSDRKEAP